MKTRLVVCALSIIAISVAACGGDEAPKPASDAKPESATSSEYGGLPATAEAPKSDERKKEEVRPMPPAAPTAAPATK